MKEHAEAGVRKGVRFHHEERKDELRLYALQDKEGCAEGRRQIPCPHGAAHLSNGTPETGG